MLGEGECWSEGGELRDITVDELHFEGSEVLRVGHFVGMLNNQVRVRLRLPHHEQLFLEEVDGYHVVHSVSEGTDGVQASDVILNYCNH